MQINCRYPIFIFIAYAKFSDKFYGFFSRHISRALFSLCKFPKIPKKKLMRMYLQFTVI